MEKIYNKLVRDKIPEIIREKGNEPITSILNEAAYKKELERKLSEECNEVLGTESTEERIEELADVLEVIKALAALEEKTLDDVVEIAKDKCRKRGGFANKIFLESVREDDGK